MTVDLDLSLGRRDFALRVRAELGTGATGVYGPNGAGKSTLLHAIAGLLPDARGRVRVGDAVLQDTATGVTLPPERRRVGLMFQDGRLFPHLTVARNLAYGRRVDEQRQAEVIDLLDLGPLLSRRPRALSGGEQQRAALGRVLVTDPRILLLDEPLASLDSRRRREILPYLRRVAAHSRVPVLYVSHHLADLLQIAERLLVLDRGEVVGHGPVGELLADPDILEVAHRLGLENVLAVEDAARDEAAGGVRARCGDRFLLLPADAPEHVLASGRGRVALRPEDVILVRDEVGATSARNVLEGTVQRVVDAPSQVAVHIDVGWPLIVAITRSAAADLGLAPGVPVHCLVKTTAFRWVG